MPEQTLQILGVKINSTSVGEALNFVRKKIEKGEKFWIATPNPEMVVLAQKDRKFKKALNSASLAIPDGIGLVLAGKLLGKNIEERVTGVDFMERLCQTAAREQWRVFLLGGKEGVASKALGVLKRKYSGLKGEAESGPGLEIEGEELKIIDKEKNQKAIDFIARFKPKILFVGFGMNKQEKWLLKYFDILNIGGAVVVGGAFDFISGRIKRAPILLQRFGFEWFWRLILEPWRIRRQLKLLEFIFLVLKEKITLFFSAAKRFISFRVC